MLTKIRKFLRSNALVILLAFIPPIVIWYFLQREETDLAVRLTANIPVVSFEEQYADGIEVFFKSTPVTSLRVVEVSVRNSGNQPIERADFDMPLTFVFSGSVLSGPTITSTVPNSLKPTIRSVSDDTLIVEPLLLNQGDQFSFRSYIANSPADQEPLEVLARIAEVDDVQMRRADEDEEGILTPFVLGFLASVLSILSVSAFVVLVKRARRIVVSFPFGLAVELTERLESDRDVASQAKHIADQLQISGHDYKSNLLLLRIKIESELREIAHSLDLPKREQMGGISRLARTLWKKGIIPQEVAAAIHDVSPAMNRELHESESYLSDEEYAVLQRLSLNVIAKLEGVRNEVAGDEDEG